MFKIHVIPAHEQASQVLSVNEGASHSQHATIHAGSFGYLSWAYVTECVYFPVHRQGAMDCYIYELTQSHLSGDKIDSVTHVHEGDMVVMQSGAMNVPLVKRVGPEFSAFEFWFSESGILQGTEEADFIKINALQFPMIITDDVVVRQLFGEDAPITHINGLKITELILPPATSYSYSLFADRKIGVYVIRGEGSIENHAYIQGDFMEVWQHDDPADQLVIKSTGLKTSRLIVLDITD